MFDHVISVSVEETYAIANAQYEAESEHMIADPPPLTQWEKDMHQVIAQLIVVTQSN